MSQARFRQIAHLEKLAQPYLKQKRQTEQEWKPTLQGAVANAAILAFLIRYGNPIIDEPLSCACQRFSDSNAWKEFSDKLLLSPRRGEYSFKPHSRDSAVVIGTPEEASHCQIFRA
jgi:hypothetical protein